MKKEFWRNDMYKRVAVVFFAFFLLLAAAARPVKAENNKKTVRIAYPIQDMVTDIDENGNYTGYTHEYLQEIAKYTGWDFEYVRVPGNENEQIETLLQMLDSGEIDFMGLMLYSEQIFEAYELSDCGYGNVYTVLQVPSVVTKDISIDVGRKQTLRVAALNTTGRLVRELLKFCEGTEITPVLIECEDEDEQVQAIIDGRADVLLNTSANFLYDMRTVASFGQRQFYFATSKGHPSEFLDELNHAMEEIKLYDPYFKESLYEKYFSPKTQKFFLTKEEEDYVIGSREINVGIIADYPPFQYKDDDGNILGISIDVLEYISETSGLNFNFIVAENTAELNEMIDGGEIDIVPGLFMLAGSGYNASVSRPYATGSNVVVLSGDTSETDLANGRMAVVGGAKYENVSKYSLVHYNTVKECIDAVSRGEVEGAYIDMYSAQFYTNTPEYGVLKMISQTGAPEEHSFAFLYPSDYRLLNIVNKAILSMPDEALQDMVFANTIRTQNMSLGDMVRNNPRVFLVIVIGVFIVVFALLMVILLQGAHAAKAMRIELERHTQLYEITNEVIFEYNYKTLNFMLSLPKTGAVSLVVGKKSADKIINYNLNGKNVPPDLLKSQNLLVAILEEKSDGIFEQRLLCGDGKWHWARLAVKIIRDNGGTPILAIGILNIIDKERDEREELLARAQSDSLTHLYNIESCRKQIELNIAELKEGWLGGLMILDIDFFKQINDTYGHLKGDEILCSLAAALQSNFNDDEVVGRCGGDEFLVYIPHIGSKEELSQKCERVCEMIRKIEVVPSHCITVSLGAAVATPESQYEELYNCADMALYKAKAAGRDRFIVV